MSRSLSGMEKGTEPRDHLVPENYQVPRIFWVGERKNWWKERTREKDTNKTKQICEAEMDGLKCIVNVRLKMAWKERACISFLITQLK